MTTYTAPHLSVADQIALLQRRGMAITDVARASAALHRIGYYRLSDYWYPMLQVAQQPGPKGKPITVVTKQFKPGASFSEALDLYVFDKLLRLLMLDAIERVEVGIRVHCAHTLGALDPYFHRDWKGLDENFVATDHSQWLGRIDNAAKRSREDFIHRFLNDYGPPLPIWVSIECWDFGMLSYFVGGLKDADKTQVANHFGIPRRKLLTSWIRNLNNVRNICAHHGRLWNRVLVDLPVLTNPGEITDLDHLATLPSARNRLYPAAVSLQWLLRTINPTSTWGRRLADHWRTFPVSPFLLPTASGFPVGWDQLPLWT